MSFAFLVKAMRVFGKLLVCGIFGVSVVGASETQNYIVKYHSPSLVKNAQEKGNKFSAQLKNQIKLPNASINVVDVMPHSRTVVVSASEREAEAIRQLNDVAFVEKDIIYQIKEPKYQSKFDRSNSVPESHDPSLDEQEIQWGLDLIQAPDAWNLLKNDESKMAGRGARVLVLDHGIDKSHPDIKSRFEKGRSFLGIASIAPLFKIPFDEYNRFVSLPANIKYDYRDDESGHGTHVAGIIAGAYNGKGIAGVAPMSRLLAAKVCSELECAASSIIRGIEYGIDEAVDVINMSIGGSEVSKAIEEALKEAERQDIVVVSTAGNDGADVIDFPALLEDVVAVGAVNKDREEWKLSNRGPELNLMAPGEDIYSAITIGTAHKNKLFYQDKAIAYRKFVDSADIESFESAEVVFVGKGLAENFKDKKVKGKFVLVERGNGTFKSKVDNALRAGAVGVLIANNKEGLEYLPSLTQYEANTKIPVFMITQAMGQNMAQAITKSKTKAVSIRRVKELSSYRHRSGTSMAAAFVSGVVALVRAANPDLTAKQTRQIIQETADELEFESGSGLVNAKNAVLRALAIYQTVPNSDMLLVDNYIDTL